MQNNPIIITLQKKPTRMDTLQLSVTVVTKNTMQLKDSTSKKPRRLVVTTAITTRKR